MTALKGAERPLGEELVAAGVYLFASFDSEIEERAGRMSVGRFDVRDRILWKVVVEVFRFP